MKSIHERDMQLITQALQSCSELKNVLARKVWKLEVENKHLKDINETLLNKLRILPESYEINELIKIIDSKIHTEEHRQ